MRVALPMEEPIEAPLVPMDPAWVAAEGSKRLRRESAP